jgi:L-asparaginase
MKMLFIQTGGTIDKDYPRLSGGYAFEFGEPAVTRMLERLNPSFEYEIVTVFQKDSLDIDDDDRKKLAQIIRSTDHDRIIITHGTDTMKETAQFLQFAVSGKVIIITGSMRPERFSDSDADLNLGAAIAAVSLLDQGIYIAMHGVVKSHKEIQRDTESGKYF